MTDPEGSGRKVGVIAQEVYSVLPEVVDVPENSEHPMTVRYSEIVSILINGLKEIDQRLNVIEEKIENM